MKAPEVDREAHEAAVSLLAGKSEMELLALRHACDAQIEALKQEAEIAFASSVKKLMEDNPQVDRRGAWREVKKLLRENFPRKRNKVEG